MKKLLILLLVAVLFTGCSDAALDHEKPATASRQELKMAWYATAPHPFFEDVSDGVEAFEKEYGIDVEKLIGPDWQQESETENIQALAAKGYRLFSVYPSTSEVSNTLYDELYKSGCRFINFGADIAEPTKAEFYVGTDTKAAAETACTELIKSMGGRGNIINVLEVLEDTNTAVRKKAIEDTVKKYPEVKVIDEISGINTVEQAIQKIDVTVSANSDKLDGIIATGDTTSVGMAQVLTEYKKNGGKRVIHAVGINTDTILLEAIKDGCIDATIAQNSYAMGYISCLLLKYMDEGWKSKSGKYTRINSGIIIVKKDNIDSINSELMKMTQEIKASLESKYLLK